MPNGAVGTDWYQTAQWDWSQWKRTSKEENVGQSRIGDDDDDEHGSSAKPEEEVATGFHWVDNEEETSTGTTTSMKKIWIVTTTMKMALKAVATFQWLRGRNVKKRRSNVSSWVKDKICQMNMPLEKWFQIEEIEEEVKAVMKVTNNGGAKELSCVAFEKKQKEKKQKKHRTNEGGDRDKALKTWIEGPIQEASVSHLE
jgi:hypothetical protein